MLARKLEHFPYQFDAVLAAIHVVAEEDKRVLLTTG
jgi:hypothetical protein